VLSPRRARRGFTVLELVGALTITAVVLGIVAGVCLRQQRVFAALAARGASSDQVHAAGALLPIDLAAIAPQAGDIRAALDTAIELRATIASAVVCDTTAGHLVLAPATSGARTYASVASPPSAADTAWILSPSDSAAPWVPYALAGARLDPPGACARGGPVLDEESRIAPRIALQLDTSGAPPLDLARVIGTPLRVTRPTRYSLYRASDNAWYAGERDWNAVTHQFNTIQPVAGPFLSPALGGLRFRYLDRDGNTLPTPVLNRAVIALVQIELRSELRGTIAVDRNSPFGARRDSAVVAVALRNAP
jgi:hypothetical protein